MAWPTLLVAGLFEVGWAIGLKHTHDFTHLWPTVATLTCMALSFVLLAHALKTLPIGTAYAVWTGIGTVGTALLGIILFAEPLETVRLGCVLLIVIGITCLRLLGRTGLSNTPPYHASDTRGFLAPLSTAEPVIAVTPPRTSSLARTDDWIGASGGSRS